jgi:hypothetical protein
MMRDWKNIIVKKHSASKFIDLLDDYEIEYVEEPSLSQETSIQIEVCVDDEEYEALKEARTEIYEDYEEYGF